MKKFATMALVVLMIVTAVFAMTACQDPQNDQPNVGKISVEETGMPQLLYVEGQELDLSNGMLTVEKDGQKQEIPLNSENITVTGYDKNKLGEQTITITYGGQSTQITVTVVARMQVVEFTSDYLVGDEFDFGVGRVKLTRNDGSNHTVLLNGEGVTITGFNGNKAGKQTLTASYTNAGETYECKFEVTVHAVDNVVFTAPKKVNYNSHEAGLDLTDGFFTLTGNNGTLVRTVVLTKDMVEGFDMSAVNKENSPFTQSLTVSYGENTYNYDVTLVYTTISEFKDEAVNFLSYDWNAAELPEITEEQGELALRLIGDYLELSPAEKAYITKDESLAVARAALMYGLDAISNDLDAMEPAFVIEGGSLEFICESPEALEAAIEILEDEKGDLYRVSPILVATVEEFAKEEMFEGMTFEMFALLPNEIYEQLLEIFETLLDAYDVMQDIGDDWSDLGVAHYADEIEAFYNEMASGSLISDGLGYMYAFVTSWNKEAKIMDALYIYYYEQDNMEALNLLTNVEMPSALQMIAASAMQMMEQIEMLGNYEQFDTTLLMYYYHMAVQQAEAVKNGDDEMSKMLYEVLPVNALLGISDGVFFSFDDLLDYIRTMEGGYYQFSGGLLGVENYHSFMDSYMALLDRMFAEGEAFENSEEYGQQLCALFEQFVDMTPTEQYYLLNALNAYYSMNVPPLAFDDSDEETAQLMCFFVILVHEYYREQLGDNAEVYNDLVIAIEIYAQRMISGTWYADFTSRMDNVTEAYEAMSADEKAIFDQYLGAIYQKYLNIRNNHVDSTELTDLGEWEDDFAALKDALFEVEIAASFIQEGQPIYSVFLSAYERAMKLANAILENAPTEIVEAYIHEGRYGLDENGQPMDGVVPMSYEYVMTNYRTMYINCLLSGMEGGSIYDGYMESNLPDFLDKCHHLHWVYLLSMVSGYEVEYEQEQVMAAVNAFRELTLDEQVTFILLEGNTSIYYSALDAYMMNYMTEGAAQLASRLIMVEQYCVIIGFNPGDASLIAGMEALVVELQGLYENASDEDKASFAPFEEMYAYYMDLIANQEEEAA